jgi:allantoin racemase
MVRASPRFPSDHAMSGLIVMTQLLIINPNTTARVTDLLAHHAQRAAPQAVIRTVTARFGAPYISCEASYLVSGHATLDAWAAALASPAPPPDAVLIGCFGDPALLALREASAAPVTGLAEAAFIEAAARGRFAVVTGGARWRPMLLRLAHALGVDDALADVVTVNATGAELLADPVAARALLARTCQQAAQDLGVQAVVLGGAGLAGMAADIQAAVDVPVIDSVLAGVRHALRLAGQPRDARAGLGGFDVAWQQVSGELAALGRHP